MKIDKDLNYAFALSYKFLWLFGVWPDPQIPWNDFRRPNIRFIFMACACLYLILPQVIYMFHTLDNITHIAHRIAAVNFFTIALLKLITTCYHGKALRALMTSVLSDWVTTKNDLERNTMLKFARRGRTLSFAYYLSSISTSMLHKWFHTLKFRRNVHLPQRGLAYQANYPYNVQKSPTYEITFFSQIILSATTNVINCTVDSFVLILILHTCAQLINLRTTLNDVVDKRVNKIISTSKFKEGLAAIIKRHNHLIENVKTIDYCYSGMLFLHMLYVTMQLCLETFEFSTIILDHLEVPFVRLIFIVFYTIVITISLFTYCYSGEKLLTESINMAYGMYECKWYDLPPKNAKDLMIIAYSSNFPLKLIAGKFGVFSIELFGTIFKTSMGYLSALLTIKG